MAELALAALNKLDAFSSFSAFENILWKKSNAENISHLITNELALKYYNYNCTNESTQALGFAPQHPIINLLMAFLDTNNLEVSLKSTFGLSSEMVFPFRNETAIMLGFIYFQKTT